NNGGKTYRPAHLTPDGWAIGDPPGALPLYGLPDLAAADCIYVCEGGKAADLARGLGVIATTAAHGAKSPHRSDWTPLAGKLGIILPDHDTSGESYTKAVIGLLGQLTPRPRLKVIRLSDIWQTGEPIPEKADIEQWLADGVPESWHPEDCRA